MGCSNSSTRDYKKSQVKSEAVKPRTFSGSSSNSLTNFKLKQIWNPDKFDNHYEILEKIGNGAFGKVYKVIHKVSELTRVVKIVCKSTIKYQDDEKEFLKEIEMLGQLDHPNIVKVFEYFVDYENYYVIQEYCKGGELYEQIYKFETFTEKIAAEVMYQLISAVCYLHSNNIVHRDLKPENIMLLSKDLGDISIKLIDFGAANYCQEGKLLKRKTGTSYYIAPEVVMKKYNKKCDVWSCGIILFILLCGYPPFDGETDDEIMEGVISKEIIYEDNEWKNLSQEAKSFVQKLLIKDYNNRITAEDSLKQAWLINHNKKYLANLNQIDISRQMQNFQKFDSKLKLKNAILAFMVHHLASEEMTKELKLVFKVMDRSGDGRLNFDELNEGIKEINKQYQHLKENFFSDVEIKRRFQAIDTDKSGFIEIEEFITVTISEELLFNEKNLKLTFNYFDKDRSGQLDREEIEELLQIRSREEKISGLVKDLILKYDTNRDGVLSFDEFKNLIKNLNPSHANLKAE